MAKTYEFVTYDDDGKGVTSAITEYDRWDGGQLPYVGRAWLDVEETAVVLACLVRGGRVADVPGDQEVPAVPGQEDDGL